MVSTVLFRGERVDVTWRVVEDDPTTNTYEIEFEFVDPPEPEATGDENEAILCELAMIDPDYYDDDVI